MKDKLPPICETWRAEAKRRKPEAPLTARSSGNGGVSLQLPTGWDDGSGKIRHVKSGPFKGRVCFSSPQEAREIAKRLEDKEGVRVRYNPD